jgi:Ala-tRNA(Pro) deacylase
MAIAITLREYLDDCGVIYDEVPHDRAVTMARVAATAHIPGDRLAKGVLIECRGGRYCLAVVPASSLVDLDRLSALTHERLGLAEERDIDNHFGDCAHGALPPIGKPYGLAVYLDDSLCRQPELFLEGGDHRTLIHLKGSEFNRLMADACQGPISRHLD